MILSGSVTRFGGLALADCAALVLLAPDWAALGHDLTHADAWVARVGPDGALASLAGAALWLCALWVAVGITTALFTTMPGRAGAIAGLLAHRVVPVTVLRVVAAATGLSILVVPVAASAATGSAGPSAPAWPTSHPQVQVAWPTNATSTPSTPSTPSIPSIPSTRPSGPTATTRPSPHPSSAPSDRVVVAPGDCLWNIAAAHLDESAATAQITAEVARWYGHNRAVIGADPSLLRPGQVLLAPTSTQ